MSITTNFLVLALAAGLVLVAFPSLCRGGGDDDDECQPVGTLWAPTQNNHSCEECCEAGHSYKTYRCSPPVVVSGPGGGGGGGTKAIMTLNNFTEGGDGGGPSECDGEFHRNSERVVALSTGWYAGGKRCGNSVRIWAKGRSVLAEVVDECDSLRGCDREHGYQPPCRYNVVDASQAVWDALRIAGDDVGEYPITWSDACSVGYRDCYSFFRAFLGISIILFIIVF